MQKFNILDRSLTIFGKHFLEASAGTGKTFAIEHLVVRLILSGKMTINQILVVTFTRAATRELKDRIHSNLQKAFRALKEGVSSYDYLQPYAEDGNAKHLALAYLDEALQCFDEAQIFTIHGFCFRMLKEFAFEAQMSFDLQDPDKNAHQKILEQCTTDFFRTALKSSFCSPTQLRVLLHEHHHDVHPIRQKILRHVKKGKLIRKGADFDGLFNRFQNLLKTGPERKKEMILADFHSLMPCYKKLSDPLFLQQVQMLSLLLEKNECDCFEFDKLLAHKEIFLEKIDVENRYKRISLPEPSTFHYPGLFEELKEHFLPLFQEAKDPDKILLNMVGACQERWNKFPNSDKLSSDEILHQMQKCLKNTTFVKKIQKRFKGAIIDEFQDTDAIQWDIFRTLFSEGMQALYLVGDPKQSIYGFRSADVYTYIQAAQELGLENKSYLDTNFRSSPSLVHALNTLFSHENTKGWLQLPRLEHALDYHPVHPKPQHDEIDIEDAKGSLHFLVAEVPKTRAKNWPPQETEEELFFPFIAREILKLHTDAGICYEEMVVLIKDRYQGRRLESFLKRFKIPSSLRRTGSLKDSLAMLCMQDLLDAVCHPHDMSKIKKVLGGPLGAWDHCNFQKGSENQDLFNVKVIFSSFKEILSTKGFGAFFYHILNTKWKDTDTTVLEKIVARDLSFYSELRLLTQRLIEFEAKTMASCSGLLVFLNELQQGDPEEDERLKIHQEETEPSVSLMTMHTSKGLEFDVVFALGLGFRSPEPEVLMSVKEDGEEKIVVFDAENKICMDKLKELEAEKMRLLYVALTRARKRVYIPLPFGEGKKTPGLGQASPIELFFEKMMGKNEYGLAEIETCLDKLKQYSKVSFEFLLKNIEFIQTQKEETQLIPIFSSLKTSFPLEYVLSFSALAKNNFESELKNEYFQVKELCQLPLGNETGNLLHRILEKIFSSKMRSLNEISYLIQKEIEFSILKDWHEEIVRMILEVLNIPLIHEKSFTLSEISSSQLLSEMEFLFPDEGNLMKGFIDLLFEKDGKYYILDWKSNWLGSAESDYTQENLEKCMFENNYFLQASIYSEALKRYVKLFDSRPFNEVFGGALYVFLRGRKVYHFYPEPYFQKK